MPSAPTTASRTGSTATSPSAAPRGPAGTSRAAPCAFPQTAPGRYEADFPLDRYGPYLLHASLEKAVDDGKGGSRSATLAEGYGHVTNPYPREYLALEPDVPALRRVAEATGGSSTRTRRCRGTRRANR